MRCREAAHLVTTERLLSVKLGGFFCWALDGPMDISEWAAFDGKNVKQIVVFCGNGKLTNGSECSKEFCAYLAIQNEEKLFEHASYCLDNAFDKGGFALQDIVNEMGRRIGYVVENGLYSGTKIDINFDGVWKSGNEWIVVEVKTTDAYRINLDKTVMQYVNHLKKIVDEDVALSALIVVGREDTGDLEAQIRGSKHAWSVRLVSIDALKSLMYLKRDLGDENFGYKVNTILRPFEYTRVDDIINLIFATQEETEKTITGGDETVGGDASKSFEFTPANELEAKRKDIVERFFGDLGVGFKKIGRASYSSEDGDVGICCTISKRYKRDYQPYWYALHPKWIEFMGQHKNGYFVLGCMDKNEAFCIPIDVVRENIENLNITKKEDSQYWHIALTFDNNELKWNISKIGKKIDLSPYSLKL